MKLIPSITIKDGCVAVAESGQYAYLRNPEGRCRNPINVIKELDVPGEEVFILDIDGLERNSPDLDTVKRIAAYREVWLDAGAGDADSMMDLFIAGASRAVMGTLCLESLQELRDALAMSDEVIFSIGYDGGIVSPDRELASKGLDELAGILTEMDIGYGIFMDLGSVREGRSVDLEAVRKLAGGFRELYVSGHIGEADLPALELAGATGAIMDFRKLEGKQDE